MITANHTPPHSRQQPDTAIRDSISYGVGMRYTNLSGTILRNVDLSHADLSGTNLRYTNLNGAILRSADLSHAKLEQIPVDFTHSLHV